MQIGEKIKQRRMELQWTQRDLATRMGYQNHSTIARIEKGTVDLPQSRIEQFAEVLGLTVAYLMDWEEVQKKNDIITDIILKMRVDNDYLSICEMLQKLDADQLASVKQMLTAFVK